ncbi:hypothetical protein NF27_HS00030 [Candidatus Jidaibacter acanthamoeba]|uniref:TonB C-terminal domain-containing protein n=1 Tax=Candidatus Jidaibacter acanthamoebae TaxID=86105 RepID=A0A0C1MWY5_9RICK|nr:TonB C-terminal domain-containing protein [Candidatus Jidaibacter acanthamoeba]KIE04416.1 hypothetical protein NF27_HS00030 [Candidatus Jidaibacter acanthamoeba]
MQDKESVYIDQFAILSFFISLLLHIFIVLCFVFYNQLFIEKIQPQRNIVTVININLIDSDIKQTGENKNPQQELRVHQVQSSMREIRNILIGKPLRNSANKEVIEQQRKIDSKNSYGITLSAHIHNNLINLPENIPSDEKVDIRIKIDKSGNLIGYKILTIHEEVINNFIKQVLLKSSPFPNPSIEDNDINSITYELSLFLF